MEITPKARLPIVADPAKQPQHLRTLEAIEAVISGHGHALVANRFPGADLGAQIAAALAELGSDPGEIHVYGGGSLATYGWELGDYQILRLHNGLYDPGTRTVDYKFPALIAGSNSAIMGDGWGTRILEPDGTDTVSGLAVCRAIGLAGILNSGANTAWGPNHGVTENVVIANLQIIGRATRSHHNGGVTSTIEIGNGHRVSIDQVFLNGTSDLGITPGGTGFPNTYVITSGGGMVSGTNTITYPAGSFDDLEEGDWVRIPGAGAYSGTEYVGRIKGQPGNTSSTLVPVVGVSAAATVTNQPIYRGNHAEDVWVTRCLLSRVESQGINCVNGRGMHFYHNTMRNQGKHSTVGCSSMDMEPNGPWDWMQEVFIGHNLIDAKGSKDETGAPFLSGNGIIVQNPNPTADFGPVHLDHNIIIGGDYRTGLFRALGAGIQVAGNDVHLSHNVVKMVSHEAFALYDCARLLVHDNWSLNCGAGGIYALTLSNVTDSEIYNNHLIETAAGDPYHANEIIEYGTSDRNIYSRNKTRSRPTLVGAASLVHSWIDESGVEHGTLFDLVPDGTLVKANADGDPVPSRITDAGPAGPLDVNVDTAAFSVIVDGYPSAIAQILPGQIFLGDFNEYVNGTFIDINDASQYIEARTPLFTFSQVARLTPITFADLPLSAAAGMIACITDCDVTNWNDDVSGGGSSRALIFYAGHTWKLLSFE